MRLQSKFSEFAISLTIIIIHHDGYFFYGAGTTTMTDLLDVKRVTILVDASIVLQRGDVAVGGEVPYPSFLDDHKERMQTQPLPLLMAKKFPYEKRVVSLRETTLLFTCI